MIKEFVNGRVAVFIDAANLSKSVESSGYKINYRKLRRFFLASCDLIYLGFYTVAFEKNIHQEFLKMLKAKGYIIIAKPLKIIWDHKKSREIHKANFDVEIAVDAMDMLDNFDTFLLFSGDSDFAYLIRRLKEKGKRTIVFSTRYHVAKELVGSSDKYLEILQFKSIFLKRA